MMNPLFQYSVINSRMARKGECPKCGNKFYLKEFHLKPVIYCKKCREPISREEYYKNK